MKTEIFNKEVKKVFTSNNILNDATKDATEKAEHLKGTVSVRVYSNDLPVVGMIHIAGTNNLKIVIETFFKEDIKIKVGAKIIELLLKKTLNTNFIDAVRVPNDSIILTHSLTIESHKIIITMLYFNKTDTFDGDAIYVVNDYKTRVKKITEHFS